MSGMLKLLFRSLQPWRHEMLETGQMAPDFEVTDHLGRSVRLNNFRGSYVVLWFFPIADTPG